MLNASRRFRYTLDLKREEEKEQIRRKIRSHAQVIRVYSDRFQFSSVINCLFAHFVLDLSQAAILFKEAGEREEPGRKSFKTFFPFLT